MTLPDPITTFTDDELDRMIDRAYREAFRSVGEARRQPAPIVIASAQSDLAYYRHLLAERKRRREGMSCSGLPPAGGESTADRRRQDSR